MIQCLANVNTVYTRTRLFIDIVQQQWLPLPSQLIHYLYDVPTLLRHLWRDLFTVQGLVMIHKAHILLILLFLVLYFLSPFDIIPEAVVGVLGKPR